MTYESAKEWLFGAQMFGIKLGLEHPHQLLAALDQPEKQLRFLHVAGTNGKGSICSFAASILREAGLQTGLFTSPHLMDFRERMTLNGTMISRQEMIEGVERLHEITEMWNSPPTFFELTFALALDWFAKRKAEIIVLETGMGGRLDATNVVHPLVTVIAPISLDHGQWLGARLEDIAKEKAGIIKRGVPLVLLPQTAGARQVILRRAEELGAPVEEIQEPWVASPVSLMGEHQRWNASAAVAACRHIIPNLPTTIIKQGLAKTHWAGRFQQIGDSYILDGAHNAAAAHCLVATWQQTMPGIKCVTVFGALPEKNPELLLKILAPITSEFLLVPVHNARGMSAPEIAALGEKLALTSKNTIVGSLEQAIALAEKKDKKVLITGSLFLVGEALALLTNQPRPPISEQ